MLKTQELTLDGEVFKMREPRVVDYRAAKGKSNEDFMVTMLSGMLLDEQGVELGEERVLNLPLRVLNYLTGIVASLLETPDDPLAKTTDSSTV